MDDQRSSLKQLQKFALCLADLHEWEMTQLPFLGTLTGRQLYFQMTQRAFLDKALASKPMKAITSDARYTDKALRIRVGELEKEGYVLKIEAARDARTKCLIPTGKLIESMYLHANQAQHIFEKEFLLIQK